MSKVVAVLAVHNEEETLPYILEPLTSCVDKVLAVIDNCQDKSEQLLTRNRKVTLAYLQGHTWKNFRAETKSFGIQQAKQFCNVNDYLLMVDCDLIVDSNSVTKAKQVLDATSKDAVIFTYKQYSFKTSPLHRVKDEIVNLFGKTTKKFTRQPVKTGIYIVRANKAYMTDVTSDYESVLSKLKITWIPTNFKHLRPRYDRRSQKVMGASRATLKDYNLLKVLLYSFVTVSPYVASSFLTSKIRRQKTVTEPTY